MTTQPDPTIRERLREHLRDAITSATAQGRESIFLRPKDAQDVLTQLDTLERRVRAAEGALDEALAVVIGAGNGTWTRSRPIEEWQRLYTLFSEARSLISGTSTDG